MSTALVPYAQPGETYTLEETLQLGKVLSSSGFFSDSREAAQAVTKILAGRELGIGAIAAMTGIYIVKGRVTMSANLMAAQVKRSGRYNYRVARLDDTGCELVFFEGKDEIGRSSFTKEDAQAAGLWNSSDPWKRTPRNMLFARAMSNGAKWFTPDIFAGPVYTPDELDSAEPLPLPPAPPVNITTGEVIDKPAPAALPAPTGRDLNPVKTLVDEIRQLGGDPGKITPRKLLEMNDADFDAYVGGMRRLRDDLITLAGSPEAALAPAPDDDEVPANL
jgi:hypothetical protein